MTIPTNSPAPGRLSRRTILTGTGLGLLAGCMADEASPHPSDPHSPDPHGSDPHGSTSEGSRTNTPSPSASAEVAPPDADLRLAGQHPAGVKYDQQLSTGGLLAGPHLSLLISGCQFTDELGAINRSVLSAKPTKSALRAAPGQQWLMFSGLASAPLRPSADHQATLQVLVGSTTIDLSGGLESYGSSGYHTPCLDQAISVGTDAPVSLVITDEGKRASLDLRTMKLASDAQTKQMMLVTRAVKAATKPARLSWDDGQKAGQKLSLELSTPRLYPWLGSWAPAGQQFLSIGYRAEVDLGGRPNPLVIAQKSITLSGSGGTRHQATSGSLDLLKLFQTPTASRFLTFVVPQDYRGGTLTLDTDRGSGPLTTKVTLSYP